MKKCFVNDVVEQPAEIDLTPMLDVVFIMLIFFIVTAAFIREAGIRLERPAHQSTSVVQEQLNIAVRLTSTNQIL